VFWSISWKLGYRYTSAMLPQAMDAAPSSEKGATMDTCSLKLSIRRFGTRLNTWIYIAATK